MYSYATNLKNHIDELVDRLNLQSIFELKVSAQAWQVGCINYLFSLFINFCTCILYFLFVLWHPMKKSAMNPQTRRPTSTEGQVDRPSIPETQPRVGGLGVDADRRG